MFKGERPLELIKRKEGNYESKCKRNNQNEKWWVFREFSRLT
jgi:hypothetical protein